jgi:pSer/pThr/pTyr-binding forkhead associated (FHA) protein
MQKLTIQVNGGEPVEYELDRDVVTLGRHPDNRIAIRNKYLSDFHAQLCQLPDRKGHEILDLGSINGTKVNGQIIDREVLRDGDTIQFGQLVAHYVKNGSVTQNLNGTAAEGRSTASPGLPVAGGSDRDRPEEAAASDPRGGDGESAAALELERAELARLKAETMEARSELNTVKFKLSKAQAEQQIATGEANKDRASLDSLRGLTMTQQRELEKVSEAVQKRRAEIEALNSDAELAREKRRSLQDELSACGRELLHANETLAQTLAQRDSLAEEIKAGGARLQAVRAELAASDPELESSIDSLEKARAELEAIGQQTQARRTELAAVEDDHQSAEEALSKMRAEYDQLRQNIKSESRHERMQRKPSSQPPAKSIGS